MFVCSQLQHTYSAVFLLPVTAASDLLVHRILLWLGYPMVNKFRRYLYSFRVNSRTWQTHRQTETAWQHRPRLCIIAWQKRCTSIVQRKLTKVDCSGKWGNIYVPRPGRFLALTAAALVYFATIALLGTQPYIRSESRFTDCHTLR